MSDARGKKQTSGWTTFRRMTAALVALAIAIGFAASRYERGLQVCESQPRKSAEQRAFEQCHPYPVGDVIPLLLVLLVLAWPDLSEIELPGLGKIVRRLDKQEARSEELVEGQTRIEGRLQAIQVSSQNVHQNVDLGEFTGIASQLAQLQTSFDRLAAGEAPGVAQQAGRELTIPEVAGAGSAELSKLWRDIEPWAKLASRLRDPSFEQALRNAELNKRPAVEAPGLLGLDLDIVRATFGERVPDVDRLMQWATAQSSNLELLRLLMRQGTENLKEPTVSNGLAVARRVKAELEASGLIA